MEREYAQALLSAVERGMEPKKAVESLREILAAVNREKLLPSILRTVREMGKRASRQSRSELVIAREADRDSAIAESRNLVEAAGIPQEQLSVRIEEALIGGWVFSSKGTRTDASFKKQLINLYRNITR